MYAIVTHRLHIEQSLSSRAGIRRAPSGGVFLHGNLAL